MGMEVILLGYWVTSECFGCDWASAGVGNWQELANWNVPWIER